MASSRLAVEIADAKLDESKFQSRLRTIPETSKRIEARTTLLYVEKRLDSSGKSLSETNIPSLKVTYILGREKDLWELVDYISGK